MWGGGVQEVNSADQIDQLNAVRFDMQSRKFSLSRSNGDEISENEMPGMPNVIPTEETYNKYGDANRRVGIGDIAEHGAFGGDAFLANPGGGP